MSTSDLVQNKFEVGDIVLVPCRVTAVGGTTARPTVTLTTKYAGFDGATDSVGTYDAIQVLVSK